MKNERHPENIFGIPRNEKDKEAFIHVQRLFLFTYAIVANSSKDEFLIS